MSSLTAFPLLQEVHTSARTFENATTTCTVIWLALYLRSDHGKDAWLEKSSDCHNDFARRVNLTEIDRN